MTTPPLRALLFVALSAGLLGMPAHQSATASAVNSAAKAALIGLQDANEPAMTRPRMLLTAESVETLRANCDGPAAAMFQAMRGRANGMLGTPATLDNNGRHYLPTFALMYVITDEERYANKAKEWLGLLAETTIENSWTCLEYIPTAAFAFDWIYPTLSDEEKRRFADGLIRQVEEIKTLWRHSDYNNHFLLEHMSELHVGLTLEGEPYREDVWRGYLEEGESWLKQHVIPAMNDMAGEDGGCAEGFSYANWGVERPLTLYLLAWLTAKGENLFPSCTFLRWAPRWNLYGQKPDGTQCRSEDCPSNHRWDQGVKAMMALCAAQYGDEYAQWMHDQIETPYPQLIWRHIIAYDPEVEAREPNDLPLGAVFRGLGHIYTRSAWQDPGATWAMFQCGPLFAGHQHTDNNSFVIHHRGALAIDSGVNEYSSHRTNYYSRSIAHNTITVYDPDETFPNAVWSPEGRGGSNDGGQRRVAFPTRVTASAAEREVRNVGTIAAFVDEPLWCYALGDASRSYAPGKVREFTRQFVHVRPSTFVIFDRVESGNRDFAKTWLLHTIDEPVVDREARTFRAEHDGGRLDGWSLLPADATLRTVGGPGREFFVDGRNFPPDSSRDARAGAWRLEVSPSEPSTDDLFLHVLHASDADNDAALPAVRLISARGREVVVELGLDDRTITLRFRARGNPGGSIRIEESRRDVVDEDFPDEVQAAPRSERWGTLPSNEDD